MIHCLNTNCLYLNSTHVNYEIDPNLKLDERKISGGGPSYSNVWHIDIENLHFVHLLYECLLICLFHVVGWIEPISVGDLNICLAFKQNVHITIVVIPIF